MIEMKKEWHQKKTRQSILFPLIFITLFLLYSASSLGDHQIVITYNPNGGRFNLGQQTQQICTGTITNDMPTRELYTFLGWSLDKNASTPDFFPGNSYTGDDIELFAIWQEPINWGLISIPVEKNINCNIPGNPYYIRFTASQSDYYCLSFDFGTINNYKIDVKLFSFDSQHTMYEISYDFNVNQDTKSIVWNVEANREYYLRITQQNNSLSEDQLHLAFSSSPVIIYDVGEGRFPYFMPHYQQIEESGLVTITNKTPERDYYTFKGWSLAENSETAEYIPGESYTFLSTTVLHAIWGEPVDWGSLDTGMDQDLELKINGNRYYYQFKAQKTGTYEFVMDRIISDFTWSTNWQNTTRISTPISQNVIDAKSYCFNPTNTSVTWQLTSGKIYTLEFTPSWMFDTSLVLSLHIHEVPVIYYDANGGRIESPMVSQQRINDDGTAVLQISRPRKENYTFLGWSENKNAISPDYLPGSTFKGEPNTILYAVWQAPINWGEITIPYTIRPHFYFQSTNTYFTFTVPINGDYVFELSADGLGHLTFNLTWPVNPPDESYVYSEHFFADKDNTQFVWHLEPENVYTLCMDYSAGPNIEEGFDPEIHIRLIHINKSTPDYVFPSSLQLIDEEAFSGAPIKYAYIPDGKGNIKINKHAFANCNRLILLRLPSNVTYIDPEAFGNTSVVLIVKSGSYAEGWAETNHYQYVIENK